MSYLKRFTDFIYGTRRVRHSFEEHHPDEKVLASDASKGILTHGEQGIQRGLDWVTSQRAVVLLTDQRIKCGNWDIPLETITDAQLLQIRSAFGPGQVLKITTEDQAHYQFGMQLNREWTDQTILALSLEKGKVSYSTFSIVVRIILAAFIIYKLYEMLM